jgi:hypothetical protein
MPIICNSYISQGDVTNATDGTGENTIPQGQFFGRLCHTHGAGYGSTSDNLYWDVKTQGGYDGSGGMWMIFVSGRSNANKVARAYIVSLTSAYQVAHDMWGHEIFGGTGAITTEKLGTARSGYDYTFRIQISGTNGGGQVSVIQMLQIGPTVQYVQIGKDAP